MLRSLHPELQSPKGMKQHLLAEVPKGPQKHYSPDRMGSLPGTHCKAKEV